MTIKSKKVVFLNVLGAAFEYYDYIIYALLTPYLSEIFFAGADKTNPILKAIMVFAVAQLARLTGGIVFGMFADKYGRRRNMIFSMGMMAAATVAIGLLPTAQQIGVLAPIILTLLRFVQGLSFGTELTTSVVFLKEYTSVSPTTNAPIFKLYGENHASQNAKAEGEKIIDKLKSSGLRISLVISSTSIGALLSTFVMYLMTKWFSAEEMKDFGWRIPFLLGGTLAIVGYFMRHGLPETMFSKGSKEVPTEDYTTASRYMAKNIWTIVAGICLVLFPASLITNNLYFPYLLNKFFAYNTSDVFFAITLSLLFAIICSPLWGKLIDAKGEKFTLFSAALILGTGYGYSFYSLNSGNFINLLVFLLLHQALITNTINLCLNYLTQIFPSNVRCTAVATCYNFAFFLSVFNPMIVESVGHKIILYGLPSAFFVLLVGSVIMLQSQNKLSLAKESN